MKIRKEIDRKKGRESKRENDVDDVSRNASLIAVKKGPSN